MRYNIVKDADEILKNSKYLIKNPSNYKNKWKTVFNNNNPICLELGMGRGSFITNMAILNPKVNYIGLEIDKSQTATAINKIGGRVILTLELFVRMLRILLISLVKKLIQFT